MHSLKERPVFYIFGIQNSYFSRGHSQVRDENKFDSSTCMLQKAGNAIFPKIYLETLQ